jgi:hypothetical protein
MRTNESRSAGQKNAVAWAFHDFGKCSMQSTAGRTVPRHVSRLDDIADLQDRFQISWRNGTVKALGCLGPQRQSERVRDAQDIRGTVRYRLVDEIPNNPHLGTAEPPSPVIPG